MTAVPPDDQLRLREAIFGTDASSCTLRHRLGDDTAYRCVEHTVTPVRTGDGTSTGFVSILADATTECQANQQLDASEDLIAGLVDTVGTIVLVLDARGRVRGVNAACEAITGLQAADLMDRPILDTLVPTDQHDAARAALAALASGATAHALETEIDADGTRRVVSWTTTMLREPDGSGRAIIAAGVDVTDQRALEQCLAQLDRLDSAGRVAAGIAHDFRSTLAVLQLRTDRLAARLLDEQSRDDVAVLRRTIDRSRALIADLLTFSRQDNVGSTVIEVNAEVTRTMSLLADLLANVTVELELDDAAPSAVLDPARFGQILTNLAINARDSMPAGGRLAVTTTRVTISEKVRGPVELPDGEYLRLTVTDSGTGIEPAQLTHVFDPYITTKPAGEGTGLGLATVHGIVTQSGGAVTFESEPDRGTTFDVWLPAHDLDGARP